MAKGKCSYCGIDITGMASRVYCSDLCRRKFNRERENDAGLKMARALLPKKTKVKPKYSIAEINKKAQEAGLTYGQYVARYGR